jgi:hypothetical protein
VRDVELGDVVELHVGGGQGGLVDGEDFGAEEVASLGKGFHRGP